MKSVFAVLATVLAFGSTSQAEVITCNFTEPFFYLQIDTEARTLTRMEPNWEEEGGDTVSTVLSNSVEIKKVEPLVKSPVAEFAQYDVEADGRASFRLTLNYQGSDGMSDFAYPYDTQYGKNFGGCDSTSLKRHIFSYEEN